MATLVVRSGPVECGAVLPNLRGFKIGEPRKEAAELSRILRLESSAASRDLRLVVSTPVCGAPHAPRDSGVELIFRA